MGSESVILSEDAFKSAAISTQFYAKGLGTINLVLFDPFLRGTGYVLMDNFGHSSSIPDTRIRPSTQCGRVLAESTRAAE